jgi:hypothetical protein
MAGAHRKDELATRARDGTDTHPFLFIAHVSPPFSSKHTLPGGLLLITKNLPDEVGLTPDGSEEHKVRAEGLLGSIGVLDVRTSRESSLALSGAEFVFSLNVLWRECLLPRMQAVFPFLLFQLNTTVEILREISQDGQQQSHSLARVKVAGGEPSRALTSFSSADRFLYSTPASFAAWATLSLSCGDRCLCRASQSAKKTCHIEGACLGGRNSLLTGTSVTGTKMIFLRNLHTGGNCHD